MTEELKTLKDFQKESNEIFADLEEYNHHKIGDTIFLNLRVEAIKWIKKLKEPHSYTDNEGVWFPDGNNFIINPSEILESFFNITEEDLK